MDIGLSVLLPAPLLFKTLTLFKNQKIYEFLNNLY